MVTIARKHNIFPEAQYVGQTSKQGPYIKDKKESRDQSIASIAGKLLLVGGALALAGYAGFQISQIYYPLRYANPASVNTAQSFLGIQQGLGEGKTVVKCKVFFPVNKNSPLLSNENSLNKELNKYSTICEDNEGNHFFPKGNLNGQGTTIQWPNAQVTKVNFSNVTFENGTSVPEKKD